MTAILLNREGALVRITLNRPDAGNAIDPTLATELSRAAAAADDPRFLRDLADTLHGAIVTMATMAKPLLVAVNGRQARRQLPLRRSPRNRHRLLAAIKSQP